MAGASTRRAATRPRRCIPAFSTKRVTTVAFVLTGALAGLASLVLSARAHAARPDVVQGMELDVIASVILGGCSLFGGRGNIFGTLLGSLIIGTLNNGLVLLGVNSSLQLVIKGGNHRRRRRFHAPVTAQDVQRAGPTGDLREDEALCNDMYRRKLATTALAAGLAGPCDAGFRGGRGNLPEGHRHRQSRPEGDHRPGPARRAGGLCRYGAISAMPRRRRSRRGISRSASPCRP